MQSSHLAFIDTMMDSLRLGVFGLPPAVLEPLENVKTRAKARDYQFYNNPKQHIIAFTQALEANEACYALLATEQLWSSAAQDSVVVADCMCAAADKCAQEDRPKEAAALL
eukprot:6097075-Prymnesium_polylepis.1